MENVQKNNQREIICKKIPKSSLNFGQELYYGNQRKNSVKPFQAKKYLCKTLFWLFFIVLIYNLHLINGISGLNKHSNYYRNKLENFFFSGNSTKKFSEKNRKLKELEDKINQLMSLVHNSVNQMNHIRQEHLTNIDQKMINLENFDRSIMNWQIHHENELRKKLADFDYDSFYNKLFQEIQKTNFNQIQTVATRQIDNFIEEAKNELALQKLNNLNKVDKESNFENKNKINLSNLRTNARIEIRNRSEFFHKNRLLKLIMNITPFFSKYHLIISDFNDPNVMLSESPIANYKDAFAISQNKIDFDLFLSYPAEIDYIEIEHIDPEFDKTPDSKPKYIEIVSFYLNNSKKKISNKLNFEDKNIAKIYIRQKCDKFKINVQSSTDFVTLYRIRVYGR